MAVIKTGLPATVSDDPKEIAKAVNRILEFIRRINGEHSADEQLVTQKEFKAR